MAASLTEVTALLSNTFHSQIQNFPNGEAGCNVLKFNGIQAGSKGNTFHSQIQNFPNGDDFHYP